MLKIKNRFIAYFIDRLYYLRLYIHPLKINGSHILMFHDIGNLETNPNQYYININDFEKIIKQYINKGYKFVSLDNIKNVKKECDKFCAITFDDGYKSVYKCALPILEKYNIPFCAFISYDFINKDNYLTNNELKSLSKNKLCTIGSHLYHHIQTRFIPNEQLIKEAEINDECLLKITNQKIRHLAFPFGNFYSCSIYDAILLNKHHHYETISTTRINIVNSKSNLLFLPRIDGVSLIKHKFIQQDN